MLNRGRYYQYDVDCSYTLDSHAINTGDIFVYDHDHSSLMIGLNIHQHSCKHNSSSFIPSPTANASAVPLLLDHGGSSFDVIFESSGYLSSCLTEDYFNGSYRLLSPVHPPAPIFSEKEGYHEVISPSDEICGQLTVTLQFEHFDAFDMIGVNHFVSLNEVIIQRDICYNTSSLPKSWYDKSIVRSKWRTFDTMNYRSNISVLLHDQSVVNKITYSYTREAPLHNLLTDQRNIWLKSNLNASTTSLPQSAIQTYLEAINLTIPYFKIIS